ncbi:type II toxin-antitoxin system HicB family antitoxin [Rubrivirga sp.]|uniref:type II toxin-antitoxin system HicB family antitoxin n=1 Tax=Rubrivirga sp. TaxID=1885344 RepID=UPI003B52AF9F
MTYRGYTAAVAYDADNGLFSGRVVDLRDVIHFEGTSVEELEAAMRETVDDYLAFCEEQGREPDRPFSGRVGLRLDTALHRAAAARAAEEGRSLNDLVVEAIRERVRRADGGGTAA